MKPAEILPARSIKEIKRNLILLESKLHKVDNFEEYFEFCKVAYNGVTFPRLVFYPGPLPKRELEFGMFRARPYSSEQLPQTECYLWEPPPEKVVKRGRCNDVGESMFYGANHFATSLIESRARDGDFWIITDFDIKDGECIPFLALGMRRQKILEQVHGEVTDLFQGFSDQDKKKNQLIDDFIHKLFRKRCNPDSNDYFETIGITKFFFEAPSTKNMLEGVTYPSVAAGAKGLNFSIRAKYARKVLIARRAFLIEINKIDLASGEIDFTPYADGKIEDGKILWTQNVTSPFRSLNN